MADALNRRIRLFDALRGFALVNMIAYHGVYDWVSVCLAAAIAGLKAVCHTDLAIVRRGKAKHNLADGNEFLPGLPLKQRI